MSKQTAVEWLDMKLDVYLELFPSEWQKLNEVIKEAKAMEREQMIDFAQKWEDSPLERYDCKEDLYNETYK
jgi:hypothetical protein